jgi:hypothetical protein
VSRPCSSYRVMLDGLELITWDDGNRFNNAGVAGEGSREGWEDVDSKDPNAISKQMLESTFQE